MATTGFSWKRSRNISLQQLSENQSFELKKVELLAAHFEGPQEWQCFFYLWPLSYFDPSPPLKEGGGKKTLFYSFFLPPPFL